MADIRIQRFARILVEHSTRVEPGDRILIEATTAAEPLVRELFAQILERGGLPHPMIAFPGMMPFSQDELWMTYARDTQLDFTPTFYKLAYEQFEGRIRIHSATNTRAATSIDSLKAQRHSKALSSITEAQMRRGAEGKFKWVTTLFPTDGYAQDAGMSLKEYEDFVVRFEWRPHKKGYNSGFFVRYMPSGYSHTRRGGASGKQSNECHGRPPDRSLPDLARVRSRWNGCGLSGGAGR